MFSTLNLHLEKVEVRKVPAVPAVFRREMVWGFAINELDDFLYKVQSNRVGESDITDFCNLFGKLALPAIEQANGVDEPDTVVIMHFKEESKETLTHYYSVLGTIGDVDATKSLPDDAIFTPLYYWDYMVINDDQCMLGNTIEFHHDLYRGFETPKMAISPGRLLEQGVVADMVNAEYFGVEFTGSACSLTNTQLTLQEHSSPSAYLRSVIDAALNARDYIKNNVYDANSADLGIHDCAQYLLGKEACVYSSPALFLLNGIQLDPLTIGQLRQWFSVFDQVVTPVLTIPESVHPYTEQTGGMNIQENMAQELTLNAMVEMAKVGLREMQIFSDDTRLRWVAGGAVANNPYLKNTHEIAQKVCDRLHKQFFTKYAELMYNIHPTVNLSFDMAGISSVVISAGGEAPMALHSTRYVYPTYKLSAWSPMVMSKDRADQFSHQVYHYVKEMINR